MHTIKLVIIGASGVGKTSLRGQYISGRFSSGYRATIGADFIAKTVPHPTKPEQSVTIQIWDTAGQERFSSLSTAFFRGADAVILAFDVHQSETLDALKKWWAEFCVGVPLSEEDLLEHPCFVVGNKIDLAEDVQDERISLDVIHHFLAELIPSRDSPPSTTSTTPPTSYPIHVHKSPSIDIKPRSSPTDSTRQSPVDRLRSTTKSMNGKFNSISSINTTASVYLTPSSSVFTDAFHTARSSPEPPSSTLSTSASTPILRTAPALRQRRPTALSTGSTSSGSAATITPSLFAREQQENAASSNGLNETASTTPEDDPLDLPDPNGSPAPGPPLPPERGPSLHFTSAKTGEGVSELFEHIAARVVRKMEYEEYFEARRLHYREASGVETIRLGTDNRLHLKTIERIRNGCCT